MRKLTLRFRLDLDLPLLGGVSPSPQTGPNPRKEVDARIGEVNKIVEAC